MIKKGNKNNMDILYFIYFTPSFIHKVFIVKIPDFIIFSR